MLNIANTIKIIAVISGLYIVFGTPKQAAAQLPQGSYLKTCTVQTIDSQNMTMVAKCRAKNDADYIRTFEYKYCVSGTIYNDNGTLHCTVDQAKINADNQKAAQEQANKQAAEQQKKAAAEQKQKSDAEKQKANNEKAVKQAQAAGEIKNAKAGFDSAAVIVMGREGKSGEIEQWVKLMKNDPKFAGNVAEGVGFNDAVAFLKQHISKPEGSKERADTISNVFREVYGRDSTAAEQAYWDTQIKTQKTWYAPMVLAEVGKLNQNSAERAAMITRVYQTAMGRAAAPNEIAYWQPRSEHYRSMIAASRNWLYSANGSTDLVETVKRALNLSPFPVTENAVKQALAAATAKKKIYAEMIPSK